MYALFIERPSVSLFEDLIVHIRNTLSFYILILQLIYLYTTIYMHFPASPRCLHYVSPPARLFSCDSFSRQYCTPPPITLSCVRLFHLLSLSSLLRFSSSFSCVSSSFFARLRQLKGMALTGFNRLQRLSCGGEADELDLKDESGVWGDHRGVPAHTVRVVRGAHKMHDLPLRHLRKLLVPPPDHLANPNL
jgi:hypothetical protein